MDNAIQDGISEGGVLNFLMPFIDGKLGGEEAGGSAIAVIDEIEDLMGGQIIAEPFIKND